MRKRKKTNADLRRKVELLREELEAAGWRLAVLPAERVAPFPEPPETVNCRSVAVPVESPPEPVKVVRCCWCGRAEGRGLYLGCEGGRGTRIYAWGGRESVACREVNPERPAALCPACYEAHGARCVECATLDLPEAPREGVAERFPGRRDDFDRAVGWGAP